ncbi:hypothetical protein IQ25_03585 [Novosphingobium taihuense]|nr:hypothetical protein IQ25_03585 [Novosphingobium taihuense]
MGNGVHRMPLLRLLKTGSIGVGLLLPSFAIAQSTIAGPTAYVGGTPVMLTLPVTASVGGRCGFAVNNAPSGSFDAGLIDQAAWSNQFPFVLNCNGAARVAVTSANGGLRTAALPSEPGYTGLAPYTVQLGLVGAGGTSATGQCEASSLIAGASAPCSFIGPATQNQGLRITPSSQNLTGAYLQVSAPAYSGPGVLVQGAYSDTLTVTVSAAI